MRTVLIAFAVSVLLALLLTRSFRDLAIRFGLYDKVEGGRKLHTRPIPRVGGLAVAVAFTVTLALVGWWEGALASAVFGDEPLIAGLVGGGSLILALGVWDDLLGARAWMKFLLQIVAALIVCAAGITIEGITLPIVGFIDLGWTSVPLTVFWIVLVTNAINLIDGMDGLAGSVVALAGTTLLIMNLVAGDAVAGLLLACLVGAVLGFLVYNVNPASIFLGDTGSLTLGFLLALVSVHSSQKAYTLFSVIGAVLILALPIFDLGMAVVRRALTAKPLFAADQHHVHHQLLRRGLSQRQSVLVLVGAAALVQVLALALVYSSDAVSAVLLLLLVPTLAALVHGLGYTDIIRHGRREIVMKQVLDAAHERENLLLGLRRDIDDLHDVDLLWARLQEVGAGLGLERLELEVEPTHLGFAVERKRLWQRSTTPEERGIHLQNHERLELKLTCARRQLGVLRLSWLKECELFAPMDRSLYRAMGDLTAHALVLAMIEDQRMGNVLPFRVRDEAHPAS